MERTIRIDAAALEAEGDALVPLVRALDAISDEVQDCVRRLDAQVKDASGARARLVRIVESVGGLPDMARQLERMLYSAAGIYHAVERRSGDAVDRLVVERGADTPENRITAFRSIPSSPTVAAWAARSTQSETNAVEGDFILPRWLRTAGPDSRKRD